MANIKLSIITVVYNGENHISPTIESVISQDFNNFEYIIIDGASTDKTLSIIKSYQNKFSFNVISEPDNGVYDAMNKGLGIATGDYVLFLNAGDELNNSKTLKSIFTKNNPDLYYGETIILNSNREEIGTRTELTSRKLPKVLKKDDFLNGQVVSHQSFIPKRSLCPSYSLQYHCSTDIEWMLSILEKTNNIERTAVPISKYLQGGISDSRLATCWRERMNILFHHFPWWKVIFAHINFAFRYLKNGAYKHSS